MVRATMNPFQSWTLQAFTIEFDSWLTEWGSPSWPTHGDHRFPIWISTPIFSIGKTLFWILHFGPTYKTRMKSSMWSHLRNTFPDCPPIGVKPSIIWIPLLPPLVQIHLISPLVSTIPPPDHIKKCGLWRSYLASFFPSYNLLNLNLDSLVEYIINTWNQAGLDVKVYKILPGHATVCTPDPWTFIHTILPFHENCFHGWSLVPFEHQISPRSLFGQPEPSIPGWYSVSKCGPHHGDITYALSFNAELQEFQVLVAGWQFKPMRWIEDDIRQDVNACRLFIQDQFQGIPQAPYWGWACFLFQWKTFVSGLLLLTLKLNQVAHLPTPTPSQISLHVTSVVDPPFMTSTYLAYHWQIWKPRDWVIISDSVHLGGWGTQLAIDLENHLVTIQLLNSEDYIYPLYSLHCSYSIGDSVWVVQDPFSDISNIHHHFMGQSGMVSDVEVSETEEITVTDSNSEEVHILTVFTLFCPSSLLY